MTQPTIEQMIEWIDVQSICHQADPMLHAIRAALVEKQAVQLPDLLPDEVRHAAWEAQYVFHGATPGVAGCLASERVINVKQREQDQAAWKAMKAALAAQREG